MKQRVVECPSLANIWENTLGFFYSISNYIKEKKKKYVLRGLLVCFKGYTCSNISL